MVAVGGWFCLHMYLILSNELCLPYQYQMVRAFGMNPKIWGLSPPQVETFSVSKTDTFTRTSIHVSKRNAVAPAQLIFQMLTLLKKYRYHQSQYSKTWDSKCLALIAQKVGAFGMNLKVWGSSPRRVETFSVSKTLTYSHEHPFVCRK